MPGNTDPIYSREGDIQWEPTVLGPTANTALDGTGSAIYSVFQADATNGGFIRNLRAKALGSPAATVMRVFICSVTGAFTAGVSNTVANTALYDEFALPLLTASASGIVAPMDIALNLALPPGYRILVTFGTSTGGAGVGYRVTGVGGKY